MAQRINENMLVRQAGAVLDFNWTGEYTNPAALSPYDTLTVGDQATPDDAALRSWARTDGFGRATEAWRRQMASYQSTGH